MGRNRRVQVTIADGLEAAIELAKKQRPDITSESAIIQYIVFAWYTNREENGKGAKLNAIKKDTEEILKKLS